MSYYIAYRPGWHQGYGESGFGEDLKTAINDPGPCLLYTSDAADERSSVDLGGRRIIKKKKRRESGDASLRQKHITSQQSSRRMRG